MGIIGELKKMELDWSEIFSYLKWTMSKDRVNLHFGFIGSQSAHVDYSLYASKAFALSIKIKRITRKLAKFTQIHFTLS